MGAFSGPRLPKKDTLVFYFDPSRDAQKGHGGDGQIGKVQPVTDGADTTAPYPAQRITGSYFTSGRNHGDDATYIYDRSGNNNHAIFWDNNTAASTGDANMQWISASITGAGYFLLPWSPPNNWLILEYDSSSLNKGLTNNNPGTNYALDFTASAHSEMKYGNGPHMFNSQSMMGSNTIHAWAYYPPGQGTATLWDMGSSSGRRDNWASKHWMGNFTIMHNGEGGGSIYSHTDMKESGSNETGSTHPGIGEKGDAWRLITHVKSGSNIKQYIDGNYINEGNDSNGTRSGPIWWMNSVMGEAISNGKIGPFMMFASEWSSAEVKDYYEDNKDRFSYTGARYATPGSDI